MSRGRYDDATRKVLPYRIHHKRADAVRTRRTEVAAADAVDERVAAAGGEDERLRDGVEDDEENDVVAARPDAALGVHPLLAEAHEAHDVVRCPADDERRRHGQHCRRHALQLAPSPPLRRRPRRPRRRARAGPRQRHAVVVVVGGGGVGDGARGGEQAAQQAPVANRHDDDRTGEPDHQLEHVPEELVSERRAGRPAQPAVVAGRGVDVGVEPDRQHDDGARQPRADAREHGVTRRPVATRPQRMHDGQVAVDAHRRHREYTRVAVHLYNTGSPSRKATGIKSAVPCEQCIGGSSYISLSRR